MASITEMKRNLDDATGPDPRLALVGVRRLLEEDLPWLEERAVRLARSQGYTWGRIGRCLQRSRQAGRQRFVALDGTPQPLPKQPVRDGDRIMSGFNGAKADARRRREFEELDPNDVVPW